MDHGSPVQRSKAQPNTGRTEIGPMYTGSATSATSGAVATLAKIAEWGAHANTPPNSTSAFHLCRKLESLHLHQSHWSWAAKQVKQKQVGAHEPGYLQVSTSMPADCHPKIASRGTRQWPCTKPPSL